MDEQAKKDRDTVADQSHNSSDQQSPSEQVPAPPAAANGLSRREVATAIPKIAVAAAAMAHEQPANAVYNMFFNKAPLSSSMWLCGDNANGNLGIGNISLKSSPVQLGSLSTWTSVAAGFQAGYAIKNGSLWAWGYNNYGGLGLNDTVLRSSPVQLGGLNNWAQISASKYSAAGVHTDGTIWCWGYNGGGQLGNNDTNWLSSPIQVGTLSVWTSVSASGGNSTIAKRKDGTLWGWGSNGYGSLGDRTIVNRSSPVQIGTLSTWNLVAAVQEHTMATRLDGTLWAWGRNDSGQLGLRDRNHRSSPVQVGSLSTWTVISNSQLFSAAIRSDGTLWGWGDDFYGELGQNSTYNNRSSPVQIGSLSTWTTVSCGYWFMTARRNDGTIWSWGKNSYGNLGLGDTANRSSPVQIGTLSKWRSVTASRPYIILLKP